MKELSPQQCLSGVSILPSGDGFLPVGQLNDFAIMFDVKKKGGRDPKQAQDLLTALVRIACQVSSGSNQHKQLDVEYFSS